MKKTKSAGGIVMNNKGEVLVVSQKGMSWSLPKGHVEAGESSMDAARREIYEESGINDLEFVKELGTYDRHRINIHGGDDLSELKTITIFLFKTKKQELRPIDDENPEARWIDKDEVAQLLTHKKDKEFFLKVCNQF